MNKQLSLVNSNLNRIFNSPLSSFVDEFFSNELPLSLINRQESFPKYNLYYKPEEEGCGSTDGYNRNRFIIELALAGYCKEKLDVYTKNNVLYVEDISKCGEEELHYLYKGITTKSFQWSMKLPKHTNIESIKFINGLLQIECRIEEPEISDERVSYKISD